MKRDRPKTKMNPSVPHDPRFIPRKSTTDPALGAKKGKAPRPPISPIQPRRKPVLGGVYGE